MMKTTMIVNPPQAWNVVPMEDIPAGDVTPRPNPDTRIEVTTAGDLNVRRITGRTEPTALIYTRIDGKDRLVGMLTPENLEQIEQVWGKP